MADRYPIGSLIDMAKIPEDALPRFLAELPTILKEMGAAIKIQAAFNDTLGDVAQMSFGEPIWIDDDLDQVHYSISDNAGEIVRTTIKREPVQ